MFAFAPPMDRNQLAISAIFGALNALGYGIVSYTVQQDKVTAIINKMQPNAANPDVIKSLVVSVGGVTYVVEEFGRAYFLTENDIRQLKNYVNELSKEAGNIVVEPQNLPALVQELVAKAGINPTVLFSVTFRRSSLVEQNRSTNTDVVITNTDDTVTIEAPPGTQFFLSQDISVGQSRTVVTLVGRVKYTLQLDGIYMVESLNQTPLSSEIVLRRQ